LTHFAQHAAQRLGHPVSLSPAALTFLSHYAWPGNVRELRNVIERAAVLGTGHRLEREDFPLDPRAPRNGTGNGAEQVAGEVNLALKTRVEALERDLVQQALEASGGSRRGAADLLGVSLRTLFYKLRRYRLE
jgi:DNA-binding NtrC family response regulator